jgi:hypothetical protein
MAGLTEDGLEIRTQPEIQTLLEEAVDAAFPGINVRAGPVQQIIGTLSEQGAIAWETLQALYSSGSREGASGVLLDFMLALTGTLRRGATSSVVVGTVNLNAGVTLPEGSIAAVAANPDAQFKTRTAVTNPGGSAADVAVVFESLNTGPVSAPAATLTSIVTPVTGWNSVTNAAAATLGRARAEDPEARAQGLIELPRLGSRTLGSIRGEVASIDEIIEVAGYENTSLVTDGDGRPGKSVEMVVWDGDPPAADDDEIAQAILNKSPEGIEIYGVGSSGTAIDDTGTPVTVPFTRAEVVLFEIDAEVVLSPTVGADWEAQAKAALVARAAKYTVGQDSYASDFTCALLAVPGIVAVSALQIGTPPVGTFVDAGYDEILRVQLSDVIVTEAP